jgi:two-component system, OmpR family, osmolarity sensor histidine kinase EnvZ
MSSYQTVSGKLLSLDQLRPGRFIKRFMPRGLFGRSFIIIVAPMVILMAIVSYVFFERDLDTTTRRMARAAAADIALLIAQEDNYDSPLREKLRALAAKQLRYELSFEPGVHIAPPTRQHRSTIDKALDEVIVQQIGEKRHFRTAPLPGKHRIAISVEVHDGVLNAIVPRDRITVSSPDIFIVWMVGSSLILLSVAILFLRNQVRPIERLARAADAFGKGRAVPDFKPYGATEVRRAAQAFLTMRDRIERHVQQRTEMLAGVSHDLKTPLTRIRLQLAMMPSGPEVEALNNDVVEMERMLDDYLDFARGEGGERSLLADLGALVRDAAEAAGRARPGLLRVDAPDGVLLSVKANALRRCVTNLIDNALKHGSSAEVSLDLGARFAEIHVDDDGPGIPADKRDEAFRPFHRLDEGRNLQAGGVGLGLSIARDIARAHGGDLILSDSPSGGLRATIRLPI